VLHLHEINFLLKKNADRFACVAFVEISYLNADTFQFEPSPCEESRTSDHASPKCLEVPNILTLSEEQYLV